MYREICTLHLAGNMLIDKDAVLRYAHAAARHAKATVELIKARLEEDAAARAEGRAGDVGLSAAFQAWLPDGYSQIFRIVCVWPFGLLDNGSATLPRKI